MEGEGEKLEVSSGRLFKVPKGTCSSEGIMVKQQDFV